MKKKECGALSNRILHELYHVCDLDAKKTYRECAEARTHKAMLCIFEDSEDLIMYINYHDECEKKKKKDEEKK